MSLKKVVEGVDKSKKKAKKKHVQFKVQESKDVDQAMKLFLVFEDGDSGVLSFSEFNEAIKEMGLDPSSDQVKRLFKRVDSDGNGRIDFEEFLKLYKMVSNKDTDKAKDNNETQEEPIVDEDRRQSLQLLKLFDKDGDGSLSVSEWQTVLKRMGMKCNPQEAEALFSNVDSNGDGKIEIDEFMRYLAK
jgi:calmodulin